MNMPFLEQKGKRVEGYTLSKILCIGNFAACNKGVPNRGAAIAVKVSDEVGIAQLEAMILRKIKGVAGVPQIFFEHTEDDLFFIGQSLGFKDLFEMCNAKKSERFSWESVRKIGTRSIEILRDIHKKDVIHGDIKASNIVVTLPKNRNNEVDILIVDFGASYIEERGPRSKKSKQTCYAGCEFSTVNTFCGNWPVKADDIRQLGYALLFCAGYDMSVFFKKEEVSRRFKRQLSDNPERFLVGDFGRLQPFFRLVGKLDSSKKVPYDELVESLKAVDPTPKCAALRLTVIDGKDALE